MRGRKLSNMLGKILLVMLAVILVSTLAMFIYHRVNLSKERSLLSEQGYSNLVSTGDHSLNVAKFGNENGKHTIVGLSGLAMGDYSVAARKMTSHLEDDNLVVFVDRAGYGLSDDTKEDMTTEYIVEDYRKALQNAGIEGPYVLMPHSFGGAYATYWVSKYPDEIEAVVFIDGSELSADAFSDYEQHEFGNGS